MDKKKKYQRLSEEDYYGSFGIKKNENGVYQVDELPQKRLEAAYQRAYENRDFEINKFWSRAAYFWGFLVVIFGAYFTIVNGDPKENPEMKLLTEAILICLGIIFSLAWYFIIIGSKHWQENWEKHIDMLENFISGPVYKTVYYEKPFYSVSKVNELLSLVIIAVWGIFLFNFILLHYEKMNFLISGVFLIGALFLFYFVFGYARKDLGKKNRGYFIGRDKPRNYKDKVADIN